MRSEKNEEQIRKKRKKLFENILSIFILLAIVLGGMTGYYGSKVMSFLDGISETAVQEDNFDDSLEQFIYLEDAEPFAALILGTDVENEGQTRSDTIIVVTVNPEKESMKMVSIPRDTLVTLPSGSLEKINATYTIGGADLTRKMVGDKLDIPIQFYATMNFIGLIELVDAVGGITIESELEFTQPNYTDSNKTIKILKGVQKVDGAEALGYARMRKEDPRGDFGRQDRQKEVVVEVLNELISFNSITNLTNILNVTQPYLKTNATANQMLSIVANYSDTINNIEQLSLNGEAGETYFPHYGFNVYTWEPYEESIWEVSQELREHLELEVEKTDDFNDSGEIPETTY